MKIPKTKPIYKSSLFCFFKITIYSDKIIYRKKITKKVIPTKGTGKNNYADYFYKKSIKFPLLKGYTKFVIITKLKDKIEFYVARKDIKCLILNLVVLTSNIGLINPNLNFRNYLFTELKKIKTPNKKEQKKMIKLLFFEFDIMNGGQGMIRALKQLFNQWNKIYQNYTYNNADLIVNTLLAKITTKDSIDSYRKRKVKRKSWLANPDSCPICLLAAKDGVIDFEKKFSNGFFAPPAHSGCRCCLLPEVKIDDYLEK